jgi:hypothetical protein
VDEAFATGMAGLVGDATGELVDFLRGEALGVAVLAGTADGLDPVGFTVPAPNVPEFST